MADLQRQQKRSSKRFWGRNRTRGISEAILREREEMADETAKADRSHPRRRATKRRS
jgi:hypothetical protein